MSEKWYLESGCGTWGHGVGLSSSGWLLLLALEGSKALFLGNTVGFSPVFGATPTSVVRGSWEKLWAVGRSGK